MSGTKPIQYVVDERGRKKSVIMSYRTYQRLLEDLADLQCIEDRKGEEAKSLEVVLKELKDVGRL